MKNATQSIECMTSDQVTSELNVCQSQLSEQKCNKCDQWKCEPVNQWIESVTQSINIQWRECVTRWPVPTQWTNVITMAISEMWALVNQRSEREKRDLTAFGHVGVPSWMGGLQRGKESLLYPGDLTLNRNRRHLSRYCLVWEMNTYTYTCTYTLISCTYYPNIPTDCMVYVSKYPITRLLYNTYTHISYTHIHIQLSHHTVLAHVNRST